MENTCENCKYYNKYYILTRNCRFRYDESGYCHNRYTRKDRDFRKGATPACKRFALRTEDVKKACTERIHAKLDTVTEKLDEILALARSDIFE